MTESKSVMARLFSVAIVDGNEKVIMKSRIMADDELAIGFAARLLDRHDGATALLTAVIDGVKQEFRVVQESNKVFIPTRLRSSVDRAAAF